MSEVFSAYLPKYATKFQSTAAVKKQIQRFSGIINEPQRLRQRERYARIGKRLKAQRAMVSYRWAYCNQRVFIDLRIQEYYYYYYSAFFVRLVRWIIGCSFISTVLSYCYYHRLARNLFQQFQFSQKKNYRSLLEAAAVVIAYNAVGVLKTRRERFEQQERACRLCKKSLLDGPYYFHIR